MYKFFNEQQDPKMIGVNPNLMRMLDNARAFSQIPFIITSGLRSVEKNKEIGGAENSAHLKGLAVDILCKNDAEAYQIILSCLTAGFKRIGIGKGHIHLDIDDTKEQKIIFIEK